MFLRAFTLLAISLTAFGQTQQKLVNRAPNQQLCLQTTVSSTATDFLCGSGSSVVTIGPTGSTNQHVVNGSVSVVQGQVKFPSSQVASANANTLDDYTEGTWTPAITPATGFTFSVQNGYFTKIGRNVCINGQLNLSAWPGASATTIAITGLPYAAANVANYNPAFNIFFSTLNTPSAGMQGLVLQNTSVMNLYVMPTVAASYTQMTITHIGNAANIFINGCYMTNT